MRPKRTFGRGPQPRRRLGPYDGTMAEVVRTELGSDERSAAMGVHIGAIFAPIWVPLIGYLLTRGRKPFIAAHARHALIDTLVLNGLIFIAMVTSLVFTVSRIWGYYRAGWEDIDWWGFVIRFAVWWIAMGILWVINLIVSIRRAMGAWRGDWPSTARRS